MVNAAIFQDYDVRGRLGAELTPQLCRDIGRAFADYLPATGLVAVGHDGHSDAGVLANGFIEGLTMQGREVSDLGVASADMVMFAIGKYDLAGGLMVTADDKVDGVYHVMLYREQATTLGLDEGLGTIRDAVMVDNFRPSAVKPGSINHRDVTEEWLSHCLTFMRGLQPLHVAIDAEHSAANAALEHLLPRLAVRATRPSPGAGPSDHLQALSQLTTGNALELGMLFSGDGRRVDVVDERGQRVSASDLFSIVASHFLHQSPAGATIVHDTRISRSATDIIRELGGRAERARSGPVSMVATLRQHNAPVAGEASGLIYYRDNYGAPSGLITALVLLQAVSDARRPLSRIVDEVHRYAIVSDVVVPSGDPQSALMALAKAFGDGQQDMLDGFSVSYPDRWFNIHASESEPLLLLTAEARLPGQRDALIQKVKTVIEE